MPRIFTTVAAVFFLAHPVAASQIASRSLQQVANDAAFVVVGTVLVVETLEESRTHGKRLLATIRAVSYLRGQAEARTFKLPLHVGGLRGFDSTIAEGDHATFFLRSIEGGKARLQTWSSFAVFPSGNFHSE